MTDLCIGSAQFGIKYGVTNRFGITSNNEIEKIFKTSTQEKIRYIDTAQAYGDAEQKIGLCIKNNKTFKVISKLPALKNKSHLNEKVLINHLEKNFFLSLKRLNIKKLDSFLVHDPKDLSNFKNEYILEWLISLKKRGLVKRIGASIYESVDLIDLPLNKIDVIQLPLSIYDQRLINDGTINKLKKNSIAIHVRSIFLQGLLLNHYSNWPKFFSNEFISHHKKFLEELKNQEISILEANIKFIKKSKFIDTVIIGIENNNQLKQFMKVWNKKDIDNKLINFKYWQWSNKLELDPRSWKELKKL